MVDDQPPTYQIAPGYNGQPVSGRRLTCQVRKGVWCVDILNDNLKNHVASGAERSAP